MTEPQDPNQPENVPPPAPPSVPPPASAPPPPSVPPAASAPPPPSVPPPPAAPSPPQTFGNYPAAPQWDDEPQFDAAGRVYDTESGLHLPPGTELASVGRRFGAYFLAIPLFIVTLGIGYIIWGLVLWGQGTTPALKVLKMKVYRVDNGTVPGFGRMALREIIGGFVDNVLGLVTGITSFILMATTRRRQSLHDFVATTTVVYDPNKVLG